VLKISGLENVSGLVVLRGQGQFKEPHGRFSYLTAACEREDDSRVRRLRAFSPLAAFASSFLLATAVISPSALAATSGCGDHQTHFDGALVSPTETVWINQALAAITRAPVNLCGSVDTGENLSEAWSMIASSDISGWAQVGYYHTAANRSDHNYFTQWHKGPDDTLHGDVFGSPALDSGHTFEVNRINNSSLCTSNNGFCLEMTVDGSASGSSNYLTDFDPHNPWPGSTAQFEGETHYTGSDIQGISSDKTFFFNIQEKDGADFINGSWAGSHGPDCPSYEHFSNPNGTGVYTAFYVWTDPPNHNGSSHCS
jgi:hypothetical protein